ncbi:hypothetical protein HWV62_43760 [Athelia sp. TMB]|nr:hypothetical protein HWV62_43760 [Athelia sp. TMB]
MRDRIQQLEDALALLQSSVSSAKHPLLRHELLSIKHGLQARPSAESEISEDPLAAPVDAFGILAIGESGEARYYGPSAGSETVLGIRREELLEDILNPIYLEKQERDALHSIVSTKVSPHKLSVLYSVIGFGSLVDLTQPANNEEGERYHHLARAALSLRSIFDSPMVETVQAILFLAYYCSSSIQQDGHDRVWMLMSLCSKVAQGIGLHRDPARWGLDAATAEHRRSLFWEVYAADQFLSLTLGRPPSIGLSYVDCAIPKSHNDSDINDLCMLSLQSSILPLTRRIVWSWKYQFHKNILGPVLELTLVAKSTDYMTVLELDRKVREAPVPLPLNLFLAKDRNDLELEIFMKGVFLSMVRSVTMVYLHKSYFARALLDHPTNPLCSPYATSFLAVARCSSAVIQNGSHYTQKFPEICMRWDALWNQLFSAAMIAGLIATRAPLSSMAFGAFTELVLAVKLFANGPKMSARVRAGFRTLCNLKEKASGFFKQQNGGAESATLPLQSDHTQHHQTDELALFSGQTLSINGQIISPIVINQTIAGTSLSPIPSSSTTGAAPSQFPTLAPENHHQATDALDVHPSLMQHISSFSQYAPAPVDLNSSSQSLGVEAWAGASHPISSMALSGLSSVQNPTGISPEQEGTTATLKDFVYDSSIDPFEHLYAETLAGDGGIEWQGMSTNVTDGADADLGEDWVTFMKQSGLL